MPASAAPGLVAADDAVAVGEPAKSNEAEQHSIQRQRTAITTSMPVAEQTGSGSDRLIQWTPFAIALGLVFSMMSDREEWLYVAAVMGGLASIAVGRTLGRSDRFSLQGRVKKFAKWLGRRRCPGRSQSSSREMAADGLLRRCRRHLINLLLVWLQVEQVIDVWERRVNVRAHSYCRSFRNTTFRRGAEEGLVGHGEFSP